jgi:hypothetical protein
VAAETAVAGRKAIRGHVAATPDGRVDLSLKFAVLGSVGLLGLGMLAGAAVAGSEG